MKSSLLFIACLFLLNVSVTGTREATVHIVKMEGMRFIPKVLEIKSGETVRWINESSTEHNVVAANKSFQSKMLPDKGDHFECTFKRPGEFQYFCQPHKIMGMKGTIIVKGKIKA
jgi:plastocyanin